MATEKERKQFFANRQNVKVIKMSGKSLHLANLQEVDRKRIMDRLAEKDEIMAQGKIGILPGLKIDGIQVTRDNIKDFEKAKPKKVESKKVKVESEPIKYTKEELEKMGFFKLRKVAKSLGEAGRSKTGLIKDILKHM